MSYTWKIRVSLPFSDCSGIVYKWFDRCAKAVCYEHGPDSKSKKPHIHVALIDCEVQLEALKRMWKGENKGKGNGFWSSGEINDAPKHLTYLTKGKFTPKAVKNFSPEELETSRLAWVDPVKDDSPGDSPTDFMIAKVLSTINYDTFMSFKEHYRFVKLGVGNTVFHSNDEYCRFLLDEVRSATMKVYWGVNHRVPHASQYKIVAGSVFLKLCEKFGIFESGIDSLKNLWY